MLIQNWAKAHGVDLTRCAAYGDSFGDVPMLECVGKAFAVSPDARLRKLAGVRGWPVLGWKEASPGITKKPGMV